MSRLTRCNKIFEYVPIDHTDIFSPSANVDINPATYIVPVSQVCTSRVV